MRLRLHCFSSSKNKNKNGNTKLTSGRGEKTAARKQNRVKWKGGKVRRGRSTDRLNQAHIHRTRMIIVIYLSIYLSIYHVHWFKEGFKIIPRYMNWAWSSPNSNYIFTSLKKCFNIKRTVCMILTIVIHCSWTKNQAEGAIWVLMSWGPVKLLIRCSKESHHPAESCAAGPPVEQPRRTRKTQRWRP